MAITKDKKSQTVKFYLQWMHSRSTYGECIYKGIIAPRWKWKMYINVKKMYINVKKMYINVKKEMYINII